MTLNLFSDWLMITLPTRQQRHNALLTLYYYYYFFFLFLGILTKQRDDFQLNFNKFA